MTDLEDQLTQALRQGAAEAPPAEGLADGARLRARARRRHRYEAVGVAAVLAVGLPIAAINLHAHETDGPQSPVASPPPWVTEPAPVGMRWESWHGVSVQVPDTWGYGFLDDGCSDVPRVERPDGVNGDVGCGRSTESYGLSFSVAPGPGLDWPVAPQYNDVYPKGAMVGTRDVAGVFIEVGTPSAALSQRILDSVVANPAEDPNGCPVILSGQRRAGPAGTVSVCRYDGDDGGLAQSELLTGSDASAAVAALAEAPIDARRGPRCAAGSDDQQYRIRVLAGDDSYLVTFGDSCWSDNRMVAPDGSPHLLTEKLLYWAISPGWSGGFDSSLVPLPDPLRSPAAG